MHAVKIFLMAVLMVSVTMSAFGQQRPASQPGGQYHALPDEKREEVRKKINAVRIWRLTETLNLDSSTSAKLSSLLSTVDHQRRDIVREETGIINTLKLAVKSPKPDESKIRISLEKLEKNRHAMQELSNNEMSELKKFLTIEQQARYVVFQHDFNHEIRGMIRSAASNTGKSGTGAGTGAAR